MAGLIFAVGTTAGSAMVATTDRCMLQIISPSNRTVKLKEWSVWFDAVLSSEAPANCRVCRMTTSTGETLSTASAFGQVIRYGSTALAMGTIGLAFNADCSGGVSSGILARRMVHKQVGYHEKFALDEEILVKNGLSIGIWVNSVTTVTCHAEMVLEE